MIQINNLYGIFELHKIESTTHGMPTSEKATAGMFTFTRDNRLSVVCGSNEWVMAYTGAFTLKDGMLIVEIEACNVREKEGTTLSRKILQLDKDWLILDASGSNTDQKTKITWKKKLSL